MSDGRYAAPAGRRVYFAARLPKLSNTKETKMVERVKELMTTTTSDFITKVGYPVFLSLIMVLGAGWGAYQLGNYWIEQQKLLTDQVVQNNEYIRDSMASRIDASNKILAELTVEIRDSAHVKAELGSVLKDLTTSIQQHTEGFTK